MAIFTLRVPDEVGEAYKAMNPANPQHAMEKQLERFKGLSHKDRALIFPNEVRVALEKLFGRPIEDPQSFVKWVESLVSAKIGDLVFALKPGQVKALVTRSAFFKKPTNEYAKVVLERVIERELGGF